MEAALRTPTGGSIQTWQPSSWLRALQGSSSPSLQPAQELGVPAMGILPVGFGEAGLVPQGAGWLAAGSGCGAQEEK